MSNDSENQDVDAMDDWGAALAEQAAGSQGGVRTAELDNLESDNMPVAGDEDRNLDMILDIPVTIAMEIGRTRISIRNLLQLNQGSVVELDRLAGEPMDVLVNGTLVAHGEVVVVNEKFGIRLTDVVSPAERVKKLR
ncbi:MAG: flagellar motor switch protein FliN [Gammaproteobacteria bacterium]|jgi:flagellar motor switch protein FliN/FliY|nr:flagellar motor switch protein FliN [Gammaproteobacteria bacterium]